MAGKKGRSGPRKTHGGWLYLRTGELPEEKKHIELELSRVRAGLVEDCGGFDVINTGQELLINQITQLHGFCLVLHDYLKKNDGPFRLDKGEIKVHGALSQFYLACQNSISRNLEKLNLHTQSKKELTDVG